MRAVRAPRASALLALAFLNPTRAHACSWEPQRKLIVEADPSDTTQPSAARVAFHVSRHPAESEGCGRTQASSCHGSATLVLEVSASDDRTPEERLGYLVTLATGNFEPLLPWDDAPILAEDGVLWIPFEDGDGRGALSFELDVWAVDEAGNLSEEATRVRVRVSEDRGCSAAGRGASMPWLVLAAVWMWRRRACRRAHAAHLSPAG